MPIDLLDVIEGEKKEASKKASKKTKKVITEIVLGSQRGAWIYLLAKEAAREAAYETLREFLEVMSKAPKDDDIDKELKRLQLEELKDRIRLKKELRKELIPIVKQQLSQLTLQQQLQNALAECIRRKKAALLKQLRKKGLRPWEIQIELMEREADIMEECEEEIRGVLNAYQGDVSPEELPVPDEEEDYSGEDEYEEEGEYEEE